MSHFGPQDPFSCRICAAFVPFGNYCDFEMTICDVLLAAFHTLGLESIALPT